MPIFLSGYECAGAQSNGRPRPFENLALPYHWQMMGGVEHRFALSSPVLACSVLPGSFICKSGSDGCRVAVLTFDMRGGHKWAKPACGRPLDGRVRYRARPWKDSVPAHSLCLEGFVPWIFQRRLDAQLQVDGLALLHSQEIASCLEDVALPHV